jgi:hypothetical protein
VFPRYEKDMLPFVQRFLRNRGYRIQATELPFYEYRIDLFGYSRSADRCLAVEMKLTKWQRALQQALIYQMCSELVSIVLPSATVARTDIDALERCAVGLISVYPSGRCLEVLQPRLSSELRMHYRDAYIRQLCA